MAKINESYLSEIHRKSTSEEQESLSSFTEDEERTGTKLAVVSDPTGGIKEVCDEFIPCLGMPIDYLNEFRRVRSSLSLNDDIEEHNKAAKITNLEQKYRRHLREDKEAKKTVEQVANRVSENDESITLVCFEKDPKWCHRYILKEEVERQID